MYMAKFDSSKGEIPVTHLPCPFKEGEEVLVLGAIQNRGFKVAVVLPDGKVSHGWPIDLFVPKEES